MFSRTLTALDEGHELFDVERPVGVLGHLCCRESQGLFVPDEVPMFIVVSGDFEDPGIVGALDVLVEQATGDAVRAQEPLSVAPGADRDRDVCAPLAVAACPSAAMSTRLPTDGSDSSLGAPSGHCKGLLGAWNHQALPPGELSHSYTRVEAQERLGLVLPATPVDRRQCHAKKDKGGDELGGLSQNGSMPPAVPTILFKSHEDPSQPTYSHVR